MHATGLLTAARAGQQGHGRRNPHWDVTPVGGDSADHQAGTRFARARNGRGGTGNGSGEREEPAPGLDPASLPPAIGAVSEDEEVRPRRRARRPRDAGDDEALEAIG